MSKEIGSFSVGALATPAVEVVSPPSVSPSLISSGSLFNFSPQIVSEGPVRVPLDSFVPLEGIKVSESGGVNKPSFELASTVEMVKSPQDLPVEIGPSVRAFNSDPVRIASFILNNEVPSPVRAFDFGPVYRRLPFTSISGLFLVPQFQPFPEKVGLAREATTLPAEQPLLSHKTEARFVKLPRVEVKVERGTSSDDLSTLRRLNDQVEQKSLQQVRERLGRLKYIKDEKINNVRLSITETALNQLAKKATVSKACEINLLSGEQKIDISKLELPAENPSVRSSLLINTPDNSYLQARSEVQHSSSSLFSTLDQARRWIMSIFLNHSAVDVGFSGEAASAGQVGEVVVRESFFGEQDSLKYLVARRINQDERLIVRADLEEVVVQTDQGSYQQVKIQSGYQLADPEEGMGLFKLEGLSLGEQERGLQEALLINYSTTSD